MADTDRSCFNKGEALNFLPFFLTLFLEVCFPISKASTAWAAHEQDVLAWFPESITFRWSFKIPQKTEVALTSLCFTGSSFLWFEDGCDVWPFPATKTFQTSEICSSLSPISYILCSFMDSFSYLSAASLISPCRVVLHSPRLWHKVQELESLRTDPGNKDPVKESMLIICFWAFCLWVPCPLSSKPVLSTAFLLL